MKKKEHKSKSLLWRLSLVLLALVLSINLMAQTITQTGVVVDQNNEPMIGVTVQTKGTVTGGITDLDGNFTIKCNKGATLVFSFMGYKTVEHKANGQRMKIEMAEDAQALDEVVIVGFGSMNKKHITGSMTSVDSKILEEKNSVNVFDALQGAAPGMQIVSNSGAPGSSSFVSIRGASTFSDEGVSPLYVVDGVVVDNIDDISANDIKQIDVMKDAASSAIYGARSANGVILITTKSGESGKPRIDARYQHSFYTVARKLPQVNAFESRLSMAASDLNNPSKTLEKFSARTDSVGMQYSTNYYYQDLLFRTGGRDDASVQISGGSKGFKYRASLNYIGEKGVILESGNDKYTANVNVDYEPWKNIKFTTRVRLSYNKTNNIKETVLQDAMRRDPDMIIWYPDGELIPYYSSGGRRNPIAELKQKLDERSTYRGNFYQGITWTFTPWLRLDADISADYTSNRNLTFSSKYLEGSDNGKNTGADKSQQTWKYAGEAYLNFNKTIAKDHSLSAMVGSSFEVSNQLAYNIAGSFFLSEDIHYMNLATVKDVKNINTTGWDEAMVGVFGRVVYSWKSRYTETGNLRFDGSSRFGKNNRWGSFPSVSAAWRVSDEPFMRWANNILTDAKIRASYGITGNDKIGRYESQTVYTAGSQYYNSVGGIVPASKYGNPDLKWEQTKQTNIGVDLSFLNGRIMFVADYYIKKTSDLLSDYNLPSTTGYDKMRVNLASIENKGVELSLTATPVRTRDFSWSTTVNWWKNDNKILDLAREDYINSAWLIAAGKPAGLFYGYKNLGVYEYDASNAWTQDYKTRLTPVFKRDNEGNVVIGLNGQPTLEKYLNPDGTEYTGKIAQMKVNGVVAGGGDVIWYNKPNENGELDGVINSNDQTELGKANPDWFGSWGNTLTYKDFSLSFNFYVSWGGQVWNDLKRYYCSWGGNTHKQTPEYIMQGWKYPGEITSWYALNSKQRKTNNHSMSLSDQFLEDATFIRLQSVRLSYSVDPKFLGKTPLRSVQAYIYGNNLLTWTNYTGYDPELSGGVLTPGKDSSKYPRKREFGFGFNIGF
ncbi:TonB-dependent receptor [Bacteroides intestinalis]|uniref:SusC/RagA family TonB-linked outer membrane protein n=1 Tax=Bacteroides intestinalis TaxID=329854 RepID=UPI0012304368|nr:TonB-dependent receptor [Bacteroides intestinalis]KAA4712491.1 TonB-dependent receptor [Bacteroides intestinalis]